MTFLFLLQHREYFKQGIDTISTTSNLQDIQFFVENQPITARFAAPTTFTADTFFRLLFKNQKNGSKGESIGYGTIGHHRALIVEYIRCHVSNLKKYSASGQTHLAAV